MQRSAFLLAVGVLASLPACRAPSEAPPEATPPAPSVDDLAWLTGAWRSEDGGRVVEELWTAPGGRMMLGLNRTYAVPAEDEPARTGAFEFLRIAEVEGGVAYVASPSGRPPVAFPLVHLGDREAVFENAEHDFPQRLRYVRAGDVLRAEVGLLDAEPSLRFAWRRVRGE